MAGEFFKNYYKKLAKEGFLKSFLFALTVGFIALFISAGLIWFIDPKLVWICPIVFVIVVGALTPLLYYKKFMPSEKYVAKRVDELERLNLLDCMECGSCAFTCPGKLPLVESFRKGKAMLREAKNK